MPIDVDVQERLREIAVATIAIAEEHGIGAVTIRAVASRLGGSTTLVTNYLPNRSELLANAVHHAYGDWYDEFEELRNGVPSSELLAALASWSCSTTGNDAVLRRLLIELFMTPSMDPVLRTQVLAHGVEHRDELLQAARQRGVDDPEFVADALYLVLRGFYLMSVEDPDTWTSERVTPVMDQLVELIAPAGRRGGRRSGPPTT